MHYYYSRTIPAKLSRNVKQHPSNSANLVSGDERGWKYMFTKSSCHRFPILFPDACHGWGWCGWHNHIP